MLVGVAKVDITPDGPILLVGFLARGTVESKMMVYYGRPTRLIRIPEKGCAI